eukprot:CAMPEP_0169400492 /NCGR_PEP_ID=MMETSP1017-20121227/53876_1 /TAXON_ID=342587 /ORGANISM="Karlodinium micrum, Strain CCMP2283" /LENGTH=127 /DNA_ID=CAMNT_0009505893 /DNA_START=105 /DNA_END=485 /DNA_ORIENTATION=+
MAEDESADATKRKAETEETQPAKASRESTSSLVKLPKLESMVTEADAVKACRLAAESGGDLPSGYVRLRDVVPEFLTKNPDFKQEEWHKKCVKQGMYAKETPSDVCHIGFLPSYIVMGRHTKDDTPR